MSPHLFTLLLSIATVLGNLLTVTLVVLFLFARPVFRRVMRLLAIHGTWLATLISSGATIGSLIYSEVVGFAPCILCIIQRVFMYPQMFLLSFSWWKPDHKRVLKGSFVLIVIGGIVALYNWSKDMLALYSHIALACPVLPGIPSCDRIYVLEYGYVTIPMFSLNVFILLGIIVFAVLRKEQYLAE